MRGAEPDPIGDHLDRLSRRLRGPSRFKRDLLREAEHGMRDAADVYAEGGVAAAQAQRLAVAEFGTVGAVLPGYQDELTAVTGRRLALLILLVPAGMLTADLMWWQPPGAGDTPPPDLFLIMVKALDWAAYAAGALALLALVLLGPATRRWPVRPRLVVRPLALTALTITGAIWALGSVAAMDTVLRHPDALRWPPMVAAWILLNAVFGLVAYAARRAGTTAALTSASR